MQASAAEGCAFLGGAGDVPSLGCLAQIVANIINMALMFLGAVTLLMLLFGAVKFITSQGDPKAIQGAQKTMTYAVFGAIAVMLVYVGMNIVTSALGLPNIFTQFSFYSP